MNGTIYTFKNYHAISIRYFIKICQDVTADTIDPFDSHSSFQFHKMDAAIIYPKKAHSSPYLPNPPLYSKEIFFVINKSPILRGTMRGINGRILYIYQQNQYIDCSSKSVLRPGVILQKGQAPLDAPMMLGASLLASKGKRQNAKASRVMMQHSASFHADAEIFKVRP